MLKTKVFMPLALLLALASCLWMTPAGATTVLAVDVPSLTREASRVVHGRVVQMDSEWSAGGRIVSRVTLEVAEDWKGSGARRVVVVQPGGEKDGFVQRVSGSPIVRPNDELVAFLQPSRKFAEAYEVLGFSQGLFRIQRDEVGQEGRVESAAGPELIRIDPVRRQAVPSPVIPPTTFQAFRRQIHQELSRSTP